MNGKDEEPTRVAAAPRAEATAELHPELSARIIGCAIRVHTALGPGFAEAVYRRALELELDSEGLPFLSELSISVSYRGRPVGRHRLDVLIASQVVLELKAVPVIERVHVAQVLAYLRAAGCRVGYVLNFGSGTLGVRRVVL